MSKCKWSQNSFCQVMVFKNTDTKVGCDGRHAACLPSRSLDLEDIRFRKPELQGPDSGPQGVQE